MLPIYCLIRQHNDFLNFEMYTNEHQRDLAPMVEHWDRTFSIPYHKVRNEISDMTRKNLAMAGFDEIFPTIQEWQRYHSNNPDEEYILYSIDNDDFVSEDIVRELAGMECGTHPIVWRHARLDWYHGAFEIWKDTRFHKLHPKIQSNHYALRYPMNPPIFQHWDVADLIGDSEDYDYNDKVLSIWNSTPLSKSYYECHYLRENHRTYKRIYTDSEFFYEKVKKFAFSPLQRNRKRIPYSIIKLVEQTQNVFKACL